MYERVVRQQIGGDGSESNTNTATAVSEMIEDKKMLQSMSVKYLGITDGKIGVLSRKVPIDKKFKEPKPMIRRNQSMKEIVRKPVV